MVLAMIMEQRQWVDADGYQHTRRDVVDVPLAVAEYYNMDIQEDAETASESNTEEDSEGPVEQEYDAATEDYVCGYEGASGTCSRSVDGPDEHCWQHA